MTLVSLASPSQIPSKSLHNILTKKQFSANQMFLWWNYKYKETKAYISSLWASYASSSSETKQAPTTGWTRWGYGTRIKKTKKWVLFGICSQTRGLSDFSHIVAALINVPPFAQQTLSCYKCAFSMQGMCAGAPPLPVWKLLKHTCSSFSQ